MLHITTLLLTLLACDTPKEDGAATEEPICDGLQQKGEGGEIDGPFDADNDGFMDINNVDCATAYDPRGLDCNDEDAAISPGNEEIACNGIDDDCDDFTKDAEDADHDGVPMCEDCDDTDENASPDLKEQCFDLVDNNCDGAVDENCGEDWNGTWVLNQRIQYSCGLGTVNMDFQELDLIYEPPSMLVDTVSSLVPGLLRQENFGINETMLRATKYVTAGTAGSCDEFYVLEGEFVDHNTFVGTFEAHFEAAIDLFCAGCKTQPPWEITATRLELD
jgi:hypothetical protein